MAASPKTVKLGFGATMAEVAALAGVTKMTVSRVVRQPEKVNPETRQRVTEAMTKLGYVPNRLAGSLTAGSTGLVAAIVPTLRHSLFADTLEGLSDVLSEAGLGLFVSSSTYRTDVEESQIQAMENLINHGVDAISINFIDSAAFGPTMAKAAAANIPVICLHSKIEGCAATLGFDERYTGKIVGEYAADLLKARYNGEVKGEVANLQGLLGQGLNTDRSGGFTDVMAQYPGVKVVAQEPTSWDPTKAVSITENWMTAYPNLDLIYGNSDSVTVPAAGVVDRAGKQEQVLIVSVDGTEPGLTAVKDGVMGSTVLLAPQYSGFWKAYFPFLVGTKADDRKEVLIQGVLVTKDNVDAALKLAGDQVSAVETFPFEKPLVDIVATY